jgi:hypothetical protein
MFGPVNKFGALGKNITSLMSYSLIAVPELELESGFFDMMFTIELTAAVLTTVSSLPARDSR